MYETGLRESFKKDYKNPVLEGKIKLNPSILNKTRLARNKSTMLGKLLPQLLLRVQTLRLPNWSIPALG